MATVAATGLRFDHVLSSPLVRAVETAEILAAAVGCERGVETAPALAQGTTAAQAALLDPMAPTATVALVGHEPTIRVLTAPLRRA